PSSASTTWRRRSCASPVSTSPTRRRCWNATTCPASTGSSTRSPACNGTTVPDFLLPDLGEGLADAELAAWHVRVGDHVTVDQVIAEVETAKAAVEVPIPFAGTVTAVHAEPGTTLLVGSLLITVTADALDIRRPAPATVQPAQASGNVLVGYGTRPASRRARARRPSPVPVPAGPPAMALPARVPVISPIVRKLARDAGVDLTHIAGTGTDG